MDIVNWYHYICVIIHWKIVVPPFLNSYAYSCEKQIFNDKPDGPDIMRLVCVVMERIKMKSGWKSLKVNKVFELQHCLNLRRKIKIHWPKNKTQRLFILLYNNNNEMSEDRCALIYSRLLTVKELLQGQGWNLNCKFTS